MAWTTDHYFRIGTAHARAGEPCQDYALSGSFADGRCYGIVTDGCSGAKARTDVGARVLALILEDELGRAGSLADCFTEAFMKRVVSRLCERPLGGTMADHLACVVAFCSNQERVRVFVAGDGAWATKNSEGELALHDVHWSSNAPGYLGYALDPVVQQRLLEAEAATATWRVQYVAGATQEAMSETSGEEVQHARELLWGRFFDLSLDSVQSLCVFTDGVSQVKGVPAVEVAVESLAFKNYAGAFSKRRMLAAFNQWEKSGHPPEDDFAVASLVKAPAEA